MADTPADARAAFASPGNRHRMLKIVHGWSEQPEAIRVQLDGLAAQGYGGVVTNINFGDGYTEADTNWSRFLTASRELRDRQMVAWLYDELGYPSGRAGALVLKERPELEVRGLMVVHRRVEAGAVEIEIPTGTPVLTKAYPIRRGLIELDGGIPLKPDGRRIVWTAPPGTWHIVAITVDRLYDGTQVACSGYP